MNQPDDAWGTEELKREIKIGIDQADRGEFVEFTAEDVIREGRETPARKQNLEGQKAGGCQDPKS